MKTAIVHDWLTGMRGGEKCLEVFCELFPEATLFTLIHEKGSVSPTIEKMDIRTSFLQRFPGISKNYRNFVFFFPLAVESFDLSEYDLVLSSSHCVAKGVRIKPGALHICYCYTPVRYAWKFYKEYFSGENKIKKMLISLVMKRLRKWDFNVNKSVDYFIAISDNVKGRIGEYYKRDADIIYPPVDVRVHGQGELKKENEGYYLVVSALVPYKRVDIAVDAFSVSGKKLVVIGSGGELKSLKARAGDNIEFRGWSGEDELVSCYKGCRALLFPGEEDFGIVPVEAQLYGKPVIAYAKGGALETIVPLNSENGAKKASGVFFARQTPEALNEAVKLFEDNERGFDPFWIRQKASGFNRDRFKKEIQDYVRARYEQRFGVDPF
jgi:glycosyltransferase involved in cell wall biosynthesis